jgi:hypothetical protein
MQRLGTTNDRHTDRMPRTYARKHHDELHATLPPQTAATTFGCRELFLRMSKPAPPACVAQLPVNARSDTGRRNCAELRAKVVR